MAVVHIVIDSLCAVLCIDLLVIAGSSFARITLIMNLSVELSL